MSTASSPAQASSGGIRATKLVGKLCAAIVAGYVLLCTGVYFLQGSMLFPAYMAPGVPENWQPAAGSPHDQALLDGRCGRLHVVLWGRAGDQGTVMVFHGNGESVASVESEVPMFHQLGYSVMAWDYPGYGRSAACRFSEDDLLQDADTAYQWLNARVPASRIVLYGRSVGAGIALHVASRHPVRQVLLVSPYDTLANVVSDHLPFFVPVELLFRYPLRAEQWIGQVQAPIHAIHGLADKLIAPERARKLMEKAHGRAEIEWVKNAGHNDISLFQQSDQWLVKQLLNP